MPLSFSADARELTTYDGAPVAGLAARWSLPAVHAFAAVGSTLDVAHALAPTAAAGTLIIADEQTAGRGRQGRRWASAPGAGVWLTIVERPTDARALDVLALRCGLLAAEALDDLTHDRIRVKWPNDLYVGERKLAGTLIETRWRGTAPEWVSVGFGLNVLQPELDSAVGLRSGVSRLAALDRIIPALRRAATASRHLSGDELARWRARDLAVGQQVIAPALGTVDGITATGEVLIRGVNGIVAHRSGSLIFAEPLTCS
ncbi:MAG: biotin--[acetyl-CoA-carboxylase] ligase [Gemmatimonadota bacterium]|nr:biotin--[acetyl-CoA-carboxylase] ligase [Gemmatimonadota bacterium]